MLHQKSMHLLTFWRAIDTFRCILPAFYLCKQQKWVHQCRSHQLSTEDFQREADAVLEFLQDKLEEYVEDNDIQGGDVEQGV